MLSGNSFHNEGPLTLNDLDAKVFQFVLGSRSKFESLEDLSPSLSTGFLSADSVFRGIALKAFIHKH